MAKITRNAFKGYTYQHYIYLLMVSIMDTEKYIESIEAEVDVNHNFDDIYMKTDKIKYRVQIKNYPNANLNEIKVINDSVKIENKEIKLSEDTNIIIINNDKFEGDKEILGLKAVKIDNVHIVPLTSDRIEKIIESMYIETSRAHSLTHFCYKRITEANFHTSKNDLPELIKFTTELGEKTILVRPTIKDIELGINCIVGKPGVGKSHYVRELKESIDELIIYRFWVSSQDSNIKKRLIFDEFFCDISYRVFMSPKEVGYDKLINEINERQLRIVIDGLDHVENYNHQELNLYIKFIKDISKARVLILTRPLSVDLPWPKKYLENWSLDETAEYLCKANGITDYSISRQIYKITQGYPIITYFLASHYNLTGKLNIDCEIKQLNDYYEKLIDNVKTKTAFSIFSINAGFYQNEEIIELLNNESLSNIIFEFTKDYPYLFETSLNRISLIHDSFNTYLRKNTIKSLQMENNILKSIQNSIKNSEIRYLSRFGNFEFKEEFVVNIINKYCDINQYKLLISKTIDYESIKEFYKIIKSYIDKIGIRLDLYKYYSLVMIILIVERNDLIGENQILYQLIKYMNTNVITESSIFSNGNIWCSYLYFIRGDDIPYKRLLNESNYSYGINYLEEVRVEEEEFFEFVDKYTDENIIWNEIINENNSNNNMDLLIDYLTLSFINKGQYYSMLNKANDNKDDKEILVVISKICRQIGVEDAFASVILKKIQYRLYELGVMRKNNPLLNNNVDDIIKEYSEEGSFSLNQYIVSYMRLANRENRDFNIYALNYYYGMYYQRKDYSVVNLNKALIVLERRVSIDEDLSLKIIQRAINQSEKGIRHILTDYINLKDLDFTKKLIKLDKFRDDFPVDIFDLAETKIDEFTKEDIIKRFYKILQYNSYGKSIPYHQLSEVLKSKYKKLILYIIKFYKYKVIEVPRDKIDFFGGIEYITSDNKVDEYKTFLEKGYIMENDLDNVIFRDISPVELSKYTDGWHSCLPYIFMYKHYSRDILNKIYLDIIHNALFAKVKGFEFTGNWWLCVGNILEFTDMIDADINWEKLKNILFDYLEISLIHFK